VCSPAMKLLLLADHVRGTILSEASESEEIVYTDIGELGYRVLFFVMLMIFPQNRR